MSSEFPPPAQTTGYKGHGPTIIIVNAILGTIATLVVSGRLYLRFRISKNSDPSDWFMLAGLLTTLAYMIGTAYACQVMGLDWHAEYLDLPRVITNLKWTFGLTFITPWSTFFIKMSILLFYRRLARHHFNTKFMLSLNIVGVLIALQSIASFVSNLLTCRPVNAFWMAADPSWDEVYHPVCINRAAYIMSFGAINLILDLVLTIIPIAMIHKIQLPRLQKIALWFLFAIGIIPSVAAIMRMWASYITFVSPSGVQDQGYNAYGIFLWTCVEYPIAMICASGPTLKTLYQHYFGTSSSSRGYATATSPDPPGGRFSTRKKSFPAASKKGGGSAWSMASLSRGLASRTDRENDTSDEQLEREIAQLQKRNQGWGPYSTTFEIDDGTASYKSGGGFGSEGEDGKGGHGGGGYGHGNWNGNGKKYMTTVTSTELGKAHTTVTTSESREDLPYAVPEYALPMPVNASQPGSPRPVLSSMSTAAWDFQLPRIDSGDLLGRQATNNHNNSAGNNHTATTNVPPALTTPTSEAFDSTPNSASHSSEREHNRTHHNSVVLDPHEWKTSNSPTASEGERANGLGEHRSESRVGQSWLEDEEMGTGSLLDLAGPPHPTGRED